MADEHVETEERGQHGVGHIVPVKVLAVTGIALLILTVITVWVASVDLGNINYPLFSELDPWLENIRGEERFKELMVRVKHQWENFEV